MVEEQVEGEGQLAPTRWDVEALRIVLAIAAVAAIAMLVTGSDGINLAGDDLGLVPASSEASNAIEVELGPEEVGLAAVGGFAPVGVTGYLPAAGSARSLQLASTVMSIIGVAVIFGAAFLILGDAAKGDPFRRRNVRRWQVMSAGFLALAVGEMVLSFARMEAKDAAGFELMTGIGFLPVLGVLVAGAMARVWDIGVGLRADTELTI